MNQEFVEAFEKVQLQVYAVAQEKGWWDTPREDGTLLMLMVGELAEAMESLRIGDPASDHIPEFTGCEEELADALIRIMDYAQHKRLRLAQAVIAKLEFNRSRPYRHGGKEF